MTDPLADFARGAEARTTAGYFETLEPAPPHRRWALAYDAPDETIRLTAASNLADVTDRVHSFFQKNPEGAAVGYLGFDAVGLFEPLLRHGPSGAPFPLGELAFLKRARRVRPAPIRGRRIPETATRVEPREDTLPRPAYGRAVERLRSAIRAGEAYQVVLAHRRTWGRPDDLWERVPILRSSERFQAFYALKFETRSIIGASPESVLEVTRGRAYIEPIAGTRPLGGGARNRLPLAVDPKELAEHRMLVDLARNDLGRIARPGAVQLDWQERSKRYARLEHLVSRVSAELRPEVTPFEALAAAFPAGTVSGAPKIRATELLRRAERTWRGPYAGAVGVLWPSGDATWALNIRSAFVSGPHLFTAAGAGIVHPSEPGREYAETLTKLAQVEAVLTGGPG